MNTRQHHKLISFVVAAVAAEFGFADCARAQLFPLPADWLRHAVTYVYISPDGSEDVEYKDNPDVAAESHLLVMPDGARYIGRGNHVWDDTTNALQFAIEGLRAEVDADREVLDSALASRTAPYFPKFAFNCQMHGSGDYCSLDDLRRQISADIEQIVIDQQKYDRLDAKLNPTLVAKN